ncbi:MAG: ANTAR domain-containing protein [Fibrella sp.]|nr:ANTAR domain-containing protein [Armatimonadota bacterium]
METYRVLIVAPDAGVRDDARTALLDAGESIVAEATSLTELQTLFEEHRPEAVLLDAGLLPLTPELRDLLHPSALVILRPAEPDPETLEKIVASAAFATLTTPFTGDDAGAEIALAVSRNMDLLDCNTELDKAQTRLADRIVVEKAKGLLIQHENLTEPEAFKRIHFTARRANRTMRNVAEELIIRYTEGTGGA